MHGGDEWCTRTPHLEREEVYVSLKRKSNTIFGDERESHRPDNINISRPHVQTRFARLNNSPSPVTLHILPQQQMKSSRNFQHKTLRSRWIGTTSSRLRRHYATLPSGTLHGCLRHLQRLALVNKQSPRRNALPGLYKTGKTPLYLPTQASRITIRRRYWTLKIFFLQ